MEESVKKFGLKIEEAADRTRWRENVKAIAEGMRCIRSPSETRKKRIETGYDDDDEIDTTFKSFLIFAVLRRSV